MILNLHLIVLSDILISKLSNIGIPLNVKRFIFNLVSFRQVICQFGDWQETFYAFRGFPQGSVLSPILYALYVSDLDKYCSSGCKILQYADDVCIYSNYPISVNVSAIEDTLNNIIKFLKSIGLTLAAQKTQLCILSKNNHTLKMHNHAGLRAPNRKYKIKVSGKEIISTNVAKFLGMIFQSDLDWSEHIKSLEKSCSFSLRTRCLCRIWWGTDPRLLLVIFQALIRSRLDYGGFLMQNLTKKLKSHR